MNELIISYLKKLEKIAKSKNETYRERAFRKAKQVISGMTTEIKNANELRGKSGIGKGIIDRIREILETKALKEVDEATTSEKDEVMERFLNIHGVGPKTAERWYQLGYKTLKDIIKNVELTPAQKIGIKYYDEINQRIPRKYILEIDEIIQKTVKEVNKEHKTRLVCEIAGSYRRKLPESGDIDCLLSYENGHLTDELIDIFLAKLKKKKLLTDELGKGESKYTGICVDSQGIHRRIDFEFVHDYSSFPYELLYFTGSQQLNLEMRQKAKEEGMILNQNGLFKDKRLIPAKNEKEIFEHIGMMYLKPEERY